MGFDHIAFGDLTLDPQIEAVDDATITAHSLLESLWTSPLVRIEGIVVDVICRVQVIAGGEVTPVPDFLELTADQHLVLFGGHTSAPSFLVDTTPLSQCKPLIPAD